MRTSPQPCYQICHRESGRMLAGRCRAAHGFWTRLCGWIGHRPCRGEALWLRPCAWIHTVGVQASIDVIFCGADSSDRIVRAVVIRLHPCRAARARGASEAFEFPAGRAQGVAPGDHLDVVASGRRGEARRTP